MSSLPPCSLVLVCGAIRAGSTPLRAWLSSHRDAHPLARPSGHLFSLMQPFVEGLPTWESHAGYFFRDRHHFTEFHASLVHQAIHEAWRHLGKPNLLVLGDPTLTLAVPALLNMLPNARFLISVRDPRAVVASRLEVLKRQQSIRTHFDEISNIRSIMAPICDEFNTYYQPLLDMRSERLLLFRYEDLVSGEQLTRVAEFLDTDLDAFDPSRLWLDGGDTWFRQSDCWLGPLFGEALSNSRISAFADALKPSLQKFVFRRCKSIGERFYS